MNRGWRFCRFNGVVNRVVSCWSLVCPAPPFCLVLGPYWTTFGLRLLVMLHSCCESSSMMMSAPLWPRNWRSARYGSQPPRPVLEEKTTSVVALGHRGRRGQRCSQHSACTRGQRASTSRATVAPPGRRSDARCRAYSGPPARHAADSRSLAPCSCRRRMRLSRPRFAGYVIGGPQLLSVRIRTCSPAERTHSGKDRTIFGA